MPPAPLVIPLLFPARGLTRTAAYGRPPAGFTLDALNVLPFDTAKGRLRGGKRPGTARAIAERVTETEDPGVAHPVQRMRMITLAAGEFVDPGDFFTDPLYDAGSGEDGDGFGGGWSRPKPTYYGGINWPPHDPILDDDEVVAPIQAGTLTVDAVTTESITLTYSAPSGGVEPLSSVLQVQNGSDWDDVGAITPGTPLVVDGLTAGTSYTFRVVTTDSYSPTQAVASATVTQATEESDIFSFVDDFDYSAGELETVSGGVWTKVDVLTLSNDTLTVGDGAASLTSSSTSSSTEVSIAHYRCEALAGLDQSHPYTIELEVSAHSLPDPTDTDPSEYTAYILASVFAMYSVEQNSVAIGGLFGTVRNRITFASATTTKSWGWELAGYKDNAPVFYESDSSSEDAPKQWATLRIEVTPGVSAELYVDDELLASGMPPSLDAGYDEIGLTVIRQAFDCTYAANLEITKFSVTGKPL